MKVLHVVPSLNPESGGPSRSIPELCRALTELGVEVTLYSTTHAGGELTIDPAAEPYGVVLFTSRLGRPGAALRLFAAMKSRAGEFDLIHLHSVWNSVVTLAATAARAKGVPYILAPRGMLDESCLNRHTLRKRMYSALFERLTIEKAARLHFINEYEAVSSRNGWFRFPEYFISPNGVDLKSLERGVFRSTHPELSDKEIMLFLGRLHPIKGLELQLEALGRLARSHPSLIWALIGPDEGEWQRVKARAESEGLAAQVRWLGQISGSERFAALADADVVLQTSFYEGHSMTINEALAVGTPLVITDTVHREDIERSGAGIIVRRDATALADAIDLVLRSPDKSQRMRIAGRELVAEKLAWPKLVEIMKEVYQSIVSNAQHIIKVSGDPQTSSLIAETVAARNTGSDSLHP